MKKRMFSKECKIKAVRLVQERGVAVAQANLDDQRCLPFRRSPFDAVVHRHTHCYVLPCSMSRFSLGRYTCTE